MGSMDSLDALVDDYAVGHMETVLGTKQRLSNAVAPCPLRNKTDSADIQPNPA